MKDMLRLRLKLIWKAITSRNALLVTYDQNDGLEHVYSGKNLMFSQLSLAVITFIEKWRKDYYQKNGY